MSIDNKSVKKIYPKAAYTPLEDYRSLASPPPVQEDPEPIAEFEYGFELSCSADSLRKHHNCEFFLVKTNSERRLMNWQIKPVEEGFRYTTAVVENEPKYLSVSKAGSSLGVTSNDPVKVHPVGAGIVNEAFIAVMPAIEVEGLLGHPSQGFFYHFCDGKLLQEYKILGEKRWGFRATHSTHDQLSDDFHQGTLTAILLPWKRDGKLINEQYLIYLRQRITRDQLDKSSESWFLQHGIKIDLSAALNAISKPIINRSTIDNHDKPNQPTFTHRVQRNQATGQRETWPEVANKYGLTARELLDLNPLYAENPLMLDVGHILAIKSADEKRGADLIKEPPPEIPQAYNQAINSHYTYAEPCIQDTTFIPIRPDSLVKDIPIVRLKTVPVPVFAKSCLVPEGKTDAGTSSEPITNFGPLSWFIGSAHANPLLIAQQATQASLAASAGGAAAYCEPCSANKDAAIGLTRLAGKLESELDNFRLIASGGFPLSLLLMHRKIWYDDDTQHYDEDLSDLDTVQSRIRISMTAPVSGSKYPTVQAWHMDFTSIPVLQVSHDEINNSYSVLLGKGGPHITWLPSEEGNPEWQLTPDHNDGYDKDDVYTTPISDIQFPSVETYPQEEELHWRDFVLVFPKGSGIPAIYIVYWEHQPRGEDGRWQPSDSTKPTLQRSSLRAETKRKIEENARKDLNGNFIDEKRNIIKDWHYGHKPGSENRRILRAAEELGMSQSELNDFVNSRPDYFQIEDAKRNLSHIDEKPGYDEIEKITRDMKRFLKNRNQQ